MANRTLLYISCRQVARCVGDVLSFVFLMLGAEDLGGGLVDEAVVVKSALHWGLLDDLALLTAAQLLLTVYAFHLTSVRRKQLVLLA